MGKTEEKFKRFADVLKNKKSMEVFIAIVVVAVIAGLFLSFGTSDGDSGVDVTSASISEYAERTEKRLKEVLSAIDGAGKVEVMITYETGPEIVPVTDTTRQSNNTESSGETGVDSKTTENETIETVTVQQNSGLGAIVLTEKQPKVRGVIIIAEGADDIRVKIALQQAVKTVLDVSLTHIDVFTMNRDHKG